MSYRHPNWVQLSVTRLNHEYVNINVNVDDRLWRRSVDNRKGDLTFRIKVKNLETGRWIPEVEHHSHQSFFIETSSVKFGSAYYFICQVYSDAKLSPVAEASKYYHTYEGQSFRTGMPSTLLTTAEVGVLKTNAIKFVRLENKEPFLADYLFRNNHPEYFEDIQKNWGNTMLVTLKNPDGDFRCPIANCLEGIEFNAGQENLLPRNSPFGDTRVVIPLERLIDRNLYNLYFADLYCHEQGSGHHVLLVVTKSGGDADTFCANRLPLLPWDSGVENPFFFFDQNTGAFKTTSAVWVSIFYTENVTIDESTDFFDRGFGRRRVGYGKLKEESCNICNLHLISRSELKLCFKDDCNVCPYINQSGRIESAANGEMFKKGKPFDCLRNVTCQIESLVYAIECEICRAQFVGVAERSLRWRMYDHLVDIVNDRNHCPLAEHINSHGSYSWDDIPMSVYVIRDDKGFDTDTWRKDKLIRWGLVFLGATCLVD